MLSVAILRPCGKSEALSLSIVVYESMDASLVITATSSVPDEYTLVLSLAGEKAGGKPACVNAVGVGWARRSTRRCLVANDRHGLGVVGAAVDKVGLG